MIFLVLLVIGSFAVLMLTPIRGLAGALILGVDAVGVDLFWQWLRISLLKKAEIKWLVVGIFGGMAIRAVSVILFLRFASSWLGMQSFNFFIFVLFLLTIPIWSLIGTYKFKLKKEN